MQKLLIQHRFSGNKLYWYVLIFLSSSILYIYGLSAKSNLHHAGNTSYGLKDYGYWIRAGQNLLQINNPYSEEPLFKSGIFSSTILYMFRILSTNDFYFFMFMQALNLAGIFIFLLSFKYLNTNNTIIFFLLLTFSSTREIFVNGQLTGLLMGLFSTFYILIKNAYEHKDELTNIKYYLFNVITGIILVFLLDIKPNLFLFPLLVVLIIYPCRLTVIIGIIVWVLHQAYFSLLIGNILFISWYENLLPVVTHKENPNFYGSLGIWQIFNQINLNQSLLQILPAATFILCGYFSLKIAKKKSISLALFLAFSTNYFYTYFHFYSFLPILAIMVYWIFLSKSTFLVGFFVSNMEFSFNLNNLNILLSIMLLLLILLLYKFPKKSDLYFFTAGWATNIFLRIGLFLFISTEPYLLKSIIVMIPFIIIGFLFAKELLSHSGERIGKF
jgi:hypothetical protein